MAHFMHKISTKNGQFWYVIMHNVLFIDLMYLPVQCLIYTTH